MRRHGRSAEDWIQAAMQALREEGPKGLRVDRLARRVGVTKGSFYWHFDGVADFEQRVLEHWLSWDTTQVARDANLASMPLARLMDIIVDRELLQYDDAVRAWARSSARAARALVVSERRRRRHVHRMLVAGGVDPQKAMLRAQMIVWTASRSGGEPMAWRHRVLRELLQLALPDVVPQAQTDDHDSSAAAASRS